MDGTVLSAYPATVLVHWPSGPVPACGRHGAALVNLGNYLGSHVVASPILEPAECANCRSEAEAEARKTA